MHKGVLVIYFKESLQCIYMRQILFKCSNFTEANQMESTGRHTSQSLDWGNINLLPLNIIVGRKQEVGYENIYVWFQIEVVVAHHLRPLVLSKRKLAGFALTIICTIYHQS